MPCIEVDSAGGIRIPICEPSLFMRATDVLAHVHMSGETVPEALLVRVHQRLEETLSALHGAKRVHGDVCLDNVVLTHFGGVTLLHPTFEASPIITCFNTPVLPLSRTHDAAVHASPMHDFFALGCLLYTMAHPDRQPPISGRSAAELRARAAAGMPPPPHTLTHTLRDAIVRLWSGASAVTEETPASRSPPAPAPGSRAAPQLSTSVSPSQSISMNELFAALDAEMAVQPDPRARHDGGTVPPTQASARSGPQPRASPGDAAPAAASARSGRAVRDKAVASPARGDVSDGVGGAEQSVVERVPRVQRSPQTGSPSGHRSKSIGATGGTRPRTSGGLVRSPLQEEAARSPLDIATSHGSGSARSELQRGLSSASLASTTDDAQQRGVAAFAERHRRSDSGSLEDHYISPVLARKLARTIARESGQNAVESSDAAAHAEAEFEAKLAEARRQAFADRMALAAKHADYVNPINPSAVADRGGGQTTAPSRDSRNSRTSGGEPAPAAHTDSAAVRKAAAVLAAAREEENARALEAARVEAFRTRRELAERSRSQASDVAAALNAGGTGDRPVTAPARRSALPRTPPKSDGTPPAPERSHNSAHVRAPAPAPAVAVGSDDAAYEAALAAARREAFEERKRLAAMYRRGA